MVKASDDFFLLSFLMKRLLNEFYSGKKTNNILVNFSAEDRFHRYPTLIKFHTHYYDGYYSFEDPIDLDFLQSLSFEKQKEYIWDRAHVAICEMAIKGKNALLLDACNCAFEKGKDLNLNTSYELIKQNVIMHGKHLKASVNVDLLIDKFIFKFILANDSAILYERLLYQSNGMGEVYMEMFKRIELENENVIILKGLRDIGLFPMKIDLPLNLIDGK